MGNEFPKVQFLFQQAKNKFRKQMFDVKCGTGSQNEFQKGWNILINASLKFKFRKCELIFKIFKGWNVFKRSF